MRRATDESIDEDGSMDDESGQGRRLVREKREHAFVANAARRLHHRGVAEVCQRFAQHAGERRPCAAREQQGKQP